MPDDVKGPGNIGKWVLLIVAIIAIIVTIYQLFLATRKDMDPDVPLPDPDEPLPDPDDPSIPGFPAFWAIDELFPPTKQFILNLPQVAHLTTLSGIFHIVSICPSCWFQMGAGVRIFAHQTTGSRIEIYRNYPINGLRTGWHSFSATPGLSNVTKLEFIIDRWFGFGERTYRLDAIQGEMVVIV